MIFRAPQTPPLARHRLGAWLSALVLLASLGACTSAPEPAREVATDVESALDSSASRTVERVLSLPPEPPPWQRPVLERARFFPFLDGERDDQSVAIGTTRDGRLHNGMALPEPGRNHQVLPVQYERGLRYGTEELIHALIDTADAVAAEFPGSSMYLGNIGEHHGGDIAWSVSHNNGRDVDIAFYALNPYGWPTRPQDLLHFGRDFKSLEHDGFYRFDVERNAALVESLIAHPEIQIQYMFMANHLARPVLEAVRRRDKLDATQMARLNEVLYEPRGALPHDDHLHLRIYCSRDDVCGGCVNDGKVREWVETYDSERQACTQEFLALADTDVRPGQRANALRRLALLDVDAHREAFLAALSDAAPEVRVAAIDALGELGGVEIARTLVAHDESEQAGEARCAAASALGRMALPVGNEHLAGLLGLELECERAGTRVPLALIVAEALAVSESQRPVAALIERLGDARPEVREASARALRHLTNRGEAVDWAALTPDSPELERAVAAWREWHTEHGPQGRDAWLVAGFQEAGFAVKALDARSIEPLLDAVKGPRHVSYNAQRVLMRISKTEPPSLSWPVGDAAWHWTRYFKKNQRRYRIDLSHRPER